MTAEKLKLILDSLVAKEDRDFTVEIMDRVHKRIRGFYLHKRRIIRVYGGERQDFIRLIMVGIHETAHHLDYKSNGDCWYSLRHAGKRIPRHGRDFKNAMDNLVGLFNFRYREVLRGIIVYDRRRPARPPRFERFDNAQQGENKEIEANISKENKIVKPKIARMAAIREIARKKTQGQIDGVMLDAYTAQAIMTVYAALTKLHKVQFAEMDIKTQAAIAFRLLAKYGS